MSLQASSFPFPETRFFRAGSNIYKFKIRGGSSYSGEEVIDRHSFNQELEEIIRTVLGNLDSLQPFSNTNFIVFPYKKQWEGMSTVMCKHSEVKLRAYPYVLILYLEKNMEKGKQVEENPSQVPCVSEPQPKRRKKDSPLEDAIIQDLLKDMEAENRVSTVSRDNTHAEGEVMKNPGRADKDESGVNTPRGSSGDVSPGTTEDMEEEEEDDDDDEDDEDDEEEESDEEGENVDSVSGSPDKPGILTRLARHMFPFSLFFRDL